MATNGIDSRLWIATATLGMTLGAFNPAEAFLNINFDSDTIGSQPAYGPSANPDTIPSAIGGYTVTTSDSPPTAASGTLVVGNVDTLSKAAILTTNPSNNVLGALWIDTAFAATSQWLSLSFDLNVLDAPTSATVQPKLLDGGPETAGILLGMNTFAAGNWQTRFAVAPTSETGGVFAIRTPDNNGLQTFFNYVEGETYNVRLESDYDTGLVSTYVNNVYTGAYAFASGPVANATTQEFFFHLNGESGHANSIAIDNIHAAIPEPASLALLALSGLAVLRRRG